MEKKDEYFRRRVSAILDINTHTYKTDDGMRKKNARRFFSDLNNFQFMWKWLNRNFNRIIPFILSESHTIEYSFQSNYYFLIIRIQKTDFVYPQSSDCSKILKIHIRIYIQFTFLPLYSDWLVLIQMEHFIGPVSWYIKIQ